MKKEEANKRKTEKNEEIREGKAQEEEKEGEKEKAKEEEKREESLKELDLNTLFVWFISMLNGKAWEYLGLIMNPETKKINKDLKKAKISIDTIAFLFDQIKDALTKEDFNRIESLLTNLRMNYVEKLKES